MVTLFLTLCGLGAVFELGLVFGVFRRAVEQMFEHLAEQLNALQATIFGPPITETRILKLRFGSAGARII